jgi:creatinine amidohydrolase/Fe(II)-dependent formamide hydrolase-like protein
MPVELARLSASRLRELDPGKTVFFFSAGPIEDHGPHLPMGFDLFEAEALARRAAERLELEMPGWTVVLLPGAPLGLESNTGRLALTVRAHVLRDWLVDSSRSLMRAGFFYFVCFTGHLGPKQLTAIEEAGNAVYRSTRWIRLWRRVTGSGKGPLAALVSANSAQVTPSVVWRSPTFLDPAEHGGRRDTSVGLALQSEPATSGHLGVIGNLVDPSYSTLEAKGPPHASRHQRMWLHWKRQDSGYWGKPAEASAGWGQGVLQGTVDEITPKLRAMLEGADPNYLFRTWYSVIPTNRTFFRAWLIAMAFGSMLLVWVFMNLWNLISE